MKCYKFKRIYKNTAVLSSLIIMFLILILADVNCKNPKDFEPPEDTLIFPPAQPVIITPADSFVFMSSTLPIYAHIAWDSIAGSQMYEFELTFENYDPQVHVATRNFYDMGILDSEKFGIYDCRVRASSSAWKGGYTDWASMRTFEIRFLPRPPRLTYPDSGQIFTLDSMSILIQFQWAKVSDEEYYEIEIYNDTMVYNNDVTVNNYYDCVFADMGSYSWRVRAGSSHWQLKTDWSDVRPFQILVR